MAINPLFMITCYAPNLRLVNLSPDKKKPVKGMKFIVFGVKSPMRLSLCLDWNSIFSFSRLELESKKPGASLFCKQSGNPNG
jgi:hypothetical protein